MKKIIIVLGMHRSGTSALTRGLGAIGVSLGENLMPAAAGNNDKGFWEDVEIVRLNNELLAELGMSWHSLGMLGAQTDFQRLLNTRIAIEAEEYLRKQTQRNTIFGLKDPRMCRLIPFWLVVFKRCNLEPVFVIATRNPLSVCQSLESRDGFLLGKSAYLWLEHLLPAVIDTKGYLRLVIDFDRLLEEPCRELQRITTLIGTTNVSKKAIHIYQEEFLVDSLRNFKNSFSETVANPELSSEVSATYQLLQKIAMDETDFEQANINTFFENVASELAKDNPAYRLIIQQDSCISDLTDQMIRLEAQLSVKESALRDRAISQNAAQQLLRDLNEIHQSTSWRITYPLRILKLASAGLRTSGKKNFTLLAKRIYHRIPAVLREPCLNFAYHRFGFLFSGIGHYENWRHSLLGSHSAPPANSYRYELPHRTSQVNITINQFPLRPLISIVTPVFGVSPKFLSLMIESVKGQWYENWELILVDDASTNPATIKFLTTLSSPKLKVVFCERNGGIAAASNIGLKHCSGEYVAFLDHDDELTPDALFEVVKAINSDSPDFIYSNEDIIDDSGYLRSPFYKPAWSAETLMSIMYTCHLTCIRKKLIDEAGGFKSAFDGAQDYDLALRVTELTKRIHHIPKVLYHWRCLPSSSSSGLNAKPYTAEATRDLKVQALARRGLAGKVEPVAEMPGQFRVNYLPVDEPLITIIILCSNLNKAHKCIAALLSTTKYKNYEVILCGISELEKRQSGYFSEIENHLRIRCFIPSENISTAALRNLAAKDSHGKFLLFISENVKPVTTDWLERLLGFAQMQHIGCVGAKLVSPDAKTIYHCGMTNTPEGPKPAFFGAPAFSPLCNGMNILDWNWSSVSGECMMVSRAKFESIGFFDETLIDNLQDADICWRLADAGYKSVNCNAVVLLHAPSHPGAVDLSGFCWTGEELDVLYKKHPHRKDQTNPYA